MTYTPVQILLATYVRQEQPEQLEFLRQQLDSLLAQNYDGAIKVIIRDDNSPHPELQKLIQQYAGQHGHVEIAILQDGKPNNDNSFIGNFQKLMEYSSASTESETNTAVPYFFFCDQDDVWHPDKISHCVRDLQRQEDEFGKNTPVMVHHHARLCDDNGNTLDAQGVDQNNTDQTIIRHFQRSTRNIIHPDLKFSAMLAHVTVPGFTIGFNRALLEVALPFPKSTVSHDHHVTLMARALGSISYIDKDFASYRIHGKNTSKPMIALSDALAESRVQCEREWDDSDEGIKYRLKRIQRLVQHCRYAFEVVSDPTNQGRMRTDDLRDAAYFSQFPFMYPESRIFAAASIGASFPDFMPIQEGLLDMPPFEKDLPDGALEKPPEFKLNF